MLLAVTLNPPPVADEHDIDDIKGKIFGACTVACIEGRRTEQIANPQIVEAYPRDVARWPFALPVVSFWTFDTPVAYAAFGQGALQRAAQTRRGHLIPLPELPGVEAEVRAQLSDAVATECPVFHSDVVRSYLATGR